MISRGTLSRSMASGEQLAELGDGDRVVLAVVSRLAHGVQRRAEEVRDRHAGDGVGYWNARKSPRWARSSAPSSAMFSPSSRISPPVIS